MSFQATSSLNRSCIFPTYTFGLASITDAFAIANLVIKQYRDRYPERLANAPRTTGWAVAEDILLRKKWYYLKNPMQAIVATALLTQFSKPDETGYLSMFVSAEKGSGAKLLREIERHCKAPWMALDCVSKLTAYYQRQGYQLVVGAPFLHDNSFLRKEYHNKVVCVHMRKRLTERAEKSYQTPFIQAPAPPFYSEWQPKKDGIFFRHFLTPPIIVKKDILMPVLEAMLKERPPLAIKQSESSKPLASITHSNPFWLWQREPKRHLTTSSRDIIKLDQKPDSLNLVHLLEVTQRLATLPKRITSYTFTCFTCILQEDDYPCLEKYLLSPGKQLTAHNGNIEQHAKEQNWGVPSDTASLLTIDLSHQGDESLLQEDQVNSAKQAGLQKIKTRLQPYIQILIISPKSNASVMANKSVAPWPESIFSPKKSPIEHDTTIV